MSENAKLIRRPCLQHIRVKATSFPLLGDQPAIAEKDPCRSSLGTRIRRCLQRPCCSRGSGGVMLTLVGEERS
jgi:hypothetical protein